ncbi:MAG: bifunctional UDP-N-acetylglucosamine diphosphorylase/glucosamine-1-phosphate N-acetyltransferase GlmU [Rhodobiaceae bacterium]|nr:bifunctional UDP-N-acetylglucosamine diphosphorylase/glucosamine-1-phosphate N-acetyltransferase GlmU [Rhodobiaceae bacterium]MCC0013561.1 bifunctional UDP-N-acetylglucosamine diphosphorylase/glucosamine-1-phosphate N-acetyltransferase GlmU [Rhodobiaceae bacterium]MCC0018325.1 bifunctional UDP-N-acetylglucosamine diphosphorylase/glucosamine-1-phosphate N-acetyltransferase GlmU [Rhodobiaceae bacterium]MCC0060644.1 bifunctional UDP-N-acetylglucosamine diphosphorylase/glucosamine-1-phosphate N-a
MADTLFVVLAAGEGTRMRSSVPKVLHKIAGREMLAHVVAAALAAGGADIAVVVGPGREDVAACARTMHPDCKVFVQTERLGTAHAVLAAREALKAGYKHVVVLFGDTPLITSATLERMIDALRDGAGIAVLGFEAENPAGYGRLVTEAGELTAIVEEKDASDAERAITLCNSGVMAFSGELMPNLLDSIGNDNAKGEYYLTDAIALARSLDVKTVSRVADETEVGGVNDRIQLAAAEYAMQQRLREAAMISGVTMRDPQSVYMNHDTKLGADVIVEQNVVFGPGVTIESGAQVRAFSHLEGCRVGANAQIGPYARLRPGADLAKGVRIGNFVEIKNARIAEGAKVNHLSYVGDATVGEAANIGAGTITCNYDGVSKHRTEIGANAFIGSNSALVAPVSIGAGAYVGSGSVITKDVEADTLAVGRGRQVEIPGWVARWRGKHKKG